MKNRGKKYYTSGAFIGGVNEVFHPSAYEAALVRETEKQLPVPAPTGDITGDFLEQGRITIILPAKK